MALPALSGFLCAALMMVIFIWIGFFTGAPIMYPPFLVRAMIVSWITGYAIYYWTGYLMKTYYKITIERILFEINDRTVEVPELPDYEIDRLAKASKKSERKPEVSEFEEFEE